MPPGTLLSRAARRRPRRPRTTFKVQLLHRVARLPIAMKLLLAIAAGRAAATTDVFLASDRLAASAAVLNSVCDNSSPSQLRLHLLAPTQEEAETLARETETACDGAAVESHGISHFCRTGRKGSRCPQRGHVSVAALGKRGDRPKLY